MNTNFNSPIECFYQWEKDTPDNLFLLQPQGDEWQTMTWGEAGQEVRKMVEALQNLNIPKGAHIGIFSKNCMHWILADLAIMMGGYISVPFYPTLNGDQLKSVIAKSDIQALFVGKLDDWKDASTGVPDDVQIISFPHYEGNVKITEGLRWEDLIGQYQGIQGNPSSSLEDLWTIIFTSGTTGTPKGVMLQCKCPILLLENEMQNGDLGVFQSKEHRFFSFLPLNHIAERIIVEMASLMTGGSISFAESLDTFAKNLGDVQPTLFLAVPRIWTKFQLAILGKIPANRLNLIMRIPIVSGFMKTRIQKALGLSKANVILTGAAPTSDSVKDWYKKFGIVLREVYGMTETCGGATLMPKTNIKSGTVGKAAQKVKIKIEEGSNEILLQMPWKMLGYYKDEEKTNQVIKDGWIHTGDKGNLDKDGFLHITGRVSDTFKTTKGKYVVPTPIEWKFADNELIEQICIVGLALPQPIALIVLSEKGQKADKNTIKKDLENNLKTANKSLANYQRVSTIVIVKEEWSVDNKVLTPTLKVRRGAINDKYKEQFLEWHEHNESILWEE